MLVIARGEKKSRRPRQASIKSAEAKAAVNEVIIRKCQVKSVENSLRAKEHMMNSRRPIKNEGNNRPFAVLVNFLASLSSENFTLIRLPTSD